MRYFRGPAQQIGWLFVLAPVAGVLSVVVMSSTLGDEDLLTAVQANQGSMLLGETLVFVLLGAMVGTAVLLSPILSRHSETLALGPCAGQDARGRDDCHWSGRFGRDTSWATIARVVECAGPEISVDAMT